MNLDDNPLGAEGLDLLEQAIQAYEAEGLEEGPHVAACLRRMPSRWASRLLSIRDHAKTTWRWRNDQERWRTVHQPGLHEQAIESCVRPDIHAQKNGGLPFKCSQCDGVRWMRMVNHGPEPVDVMTEDSRVAHTYMPGEEYVIPCDRCSPRRCVQYRTRKPIKSRDQPEDRRKAKTVIEEED